MMKEDPDSKYCVSARQMNFQLSEIHRRRLQWIFPAFLAIFIIIFLRLFQIWVLPGDNLKKELELRTGTLYVQEPRGRIFDRSSKILACDIPAPSLYVDPRKVTDENRAKLISHLQQHLGMSEEEILPCLAKTSKKGKVREGFPVKRWLMGKSESDLEALINFEGRVLYLVSESVRNYPQGDTASHVLGFVNREGDASEGLELAFDGYLKCKPGAISARKDNQRRLLPSSLISYEPPKGGDMVQLTLDLAIQQTLEKALDARMEEVGAKVGLGIIMDPHTGAILALASRPAFDPNNYNATPIESRRNKAVLNFFEPGSAFKIVAAAAALEHGLVTPDTMIDCEGGAFNPYGHRIRDFYKLGVIPFWKIIEKSSNIGIIKVGAMLGPERFEEWIRRFGFGATTSPDFQFESRGLFRPRKKWSKLSMGSLPMGQEIAVTMPQLAKAFAVIANGGFVVQPYYVERAVNRDDIVTYQHESPPVKRILSEETARLMQEMLHGVVLHGTGKAANIEEYRACGKTGTAQMAYENGKGRGFDPNRYTSVFAGFAPLANPRVVGVIVIQEPSKERYGGHVCGPVFAEVVRYALIRMGVPQDPVVDPENPQKVEMSPLLAKMTEAAEQQLLKTDALSQVEMNNDADTVVPRPTPEDLDVDLASLITPLDTLDLLPGRALDPSSSRTVPNLIGMTKSQAQESLQRLGIIMDAQGVGWVSAQNPEPGTLVEEGTMCALQFGNKLSGADKDDTG